MKNKIALVTGAARGIGLACAKLFIEKGLKTIAVDIDEDELNKVKEAIDSPLLECCVCDVANEDAVNALCNEMLERYKAVDILVNNAGIFRCDRGPFSESKSEHWRKKIDCNIYGTLFFTRALIGAMIKQKDGRIVNLSSVTAKYGAKNMADYALTKGAIASFTRSLAKEVGEFNVRVNSVSPGNIEPDDRYPEMSYLNRSGSYEECARLIVFLCSDEASFITGEDYVVDGGRKKI